MNYDTDSVPDAVKRAVEFVTGGDPDGARAALGSIDYSDLISGRRAALKSRRVRLTRQKIWGERPASKAMTVPRVQKAYSRQPVPISMMLSIFERDHFTCRYSHCRKRTLYVPVLRALSKLLPDALPYQSNWLPIDEHILYWTYGTSLEHRVSFPQGGTSEPENLITACYQCNDIKNMISGTDLGWEVEAERNGDWDGLSSYLCRLQHLGLSGSKNCVTSRRW